MHSKVVGVILFVAFTLVGPSAAMQGDEDLSKRKPVKIRGKQNAPAFADIAEWINSEPLTMKGMRGKVVVVHFMAFG
ncbi:MAG: hypothetical protein FJ271_05690 [Planctomycetes bacterium]|nr:hypothetical protein [Planctomycetota bacterium]